MCRAWVLLSPWLALAALLPASAPAGTESDAESAFRATLTRARQAYDSGRTGEARTLADSLLRATEQREGPESLRTCDALELAVLCAFSLRFRTDPATCALADRAVRIRERTDGPDSLKLQHALQLASRCAHRSGELERAIGLQLRVLPIEERARGPESYDLSVHLNNLASILYEAGRYAEMTPVMHHALAIRQKHRPADDPDLLRLRNNLAVALEAAGDYTAAGPLYEEVLAGYEKRLGPTSGKTGYALNNLATVLAMTGEPERARDLYERALRVRESAAGVNPFEVGETLTNLADLLADQGDLSGARPLYERALAIQTEHLRADHDDRIQTLLGLAAVHRSRGDLAEARRLARGALSAVEGSGQPRHPSAAHALVSLGETELAAGDFAAAVPLLERAVELFQRALGDRHPQLAEARGLLADALARIGDDRAMAQALEAEQVSREHLHHVLRTLPERQALAVRADAPAALGVALSALAATAAATDSARYAVWDALVRSRGLVLDEIASRIHFDPGGDTAVVRLEREFIAARRREVNLAVRGPRDGSLDEYRRRLEGSRREAAAAEAALARASAEFRHELARGRIGLAAVLAQLPRDAAMVAYVRFERVTRQPGAGTPGSREEYGAFVARAGDRAPAFVPLGAADEIDSLVALWHRAAEGPSDAEPAYRRVAAGLRDRVWDPVVRLVEPAGLAFVVADGALAHVNPATFPAGSTAYLVERGPTFHFLTTERDLLEAGVARPSRTGTMIAVGGVDYDAGAGDPEAVATVAAAARRGPGGGARSRAPATDCADLAALRFVALPQTRREIADVCALWTRGRVEHPARTLTGAEATEQAFRALAPRGRILHLATHGYFVGGTCDRASGPGIVAGPPRSRREHGSDPFVRSGLAFAGANQRRGPGGSGDDGILTAAEIAALELEGVEWVVLSGCDTGIGSPVEMEGLLGLRRAFQVAGARTLVMSLWGVEDAPTRRWVRELYAARLDRGRSTPAAVREASRALLDAQRAGAQGGHPAAWGAFISSGDWR